MSISTKTRPTTKYTSNIYNLINSKDVVGMTMLPDGTALVKMKTEEVLKQYATAVIVSNLIRDGIQSGGIESRKLEGNETTLTREEKSKTTDKGSRFVRKRRGPTDAMKRQLKEFEAFLRLHPIEPGKRKDSIGARANQFWHKYWRKLGAEAKETGSRHGYRNPRSLADGARKYLLEAVESN